MARAISTKTLLEKTHKTYELEGVWADVLGKPSRGGIWVIYGDEKNGKTAFALALSELLSKFDKVWYISAEEGVGKEFQDNVKRVRIDSKNSKIMWSEYTEIDEMTSKLEKRQGPKICVLDNATVYADDLKNGVLKKLLQNHPNTLFILLAHMEKNEPYTATAKLAKKLAKIIFRVEGLTAFVYGRCPGGILTIDENTSKLYHGTQISNN